MTNQPTRTDPLARYAVYALMALALWAGVRQLTPQAEPTMAQGIIIVPTAALPTARPDDGSLMLIAPTAIQPTEAAPAATPAPEVAAPASFIASPDSPPQNGAQEADVPDNASYLENVGAQAEHSPRGDVAPAEVATEPPLDALNDPALNGHNVAPEGCPFPIVNGICANGTPASTIDDGATGQKSTAPGADPAHAAPIAADVPPLSDAQAAIIGARTSDTCPAGQTFYPRTGCHTPGSGGPMPGAVGEAP